MMMMMMLASLFGLTLYRLIAFDSIKAGKKKVHQISRCFTGFIHVSNPGGQQWSSTWNDMTQGQTKLPMITRGVISKLYLETISWIRNRGRSILWVVLIKFAFKCFWTPENHRKVRSAHCRIRWSDPPSPKRMALWRILMKTVIHRLSSYWRERTKSPHQQQVVMQRNARGDHRSLWWKHPKDAFLSPFGWEWRMNHTNRP